MENYELQICKEFVFSVGNLGQSLDFYLNFIGFEKIYEGKADRSQLDYWNLPLNCSADEVLLQYPGLGIGQLRLIQFQNVPQKIIRSGSQAWDTGGIYDIDLRVKDIHSVYTEMQNMGWHGTCDPVKQEMGQFVLKEVLMKGPDEVVIALVDRIEPPLPSDKEKGFISHIYLSAMIVKDHTVAYDFFINQLGFRLMNDLEVVNQTEGPNMFGIPHNLSTKHAAKLSLIAPTESRDGMFDILQFEGLTGNDFSSYALPPNRGILMYRFPIKGLENYYQKLLSKNTKVHIPPKKVKIQPYGELLVMVIRSPDGVWLEFFE